MNPFADAPIVSSYSRAQAIDDGVLIDLTELAKPFGFKFPVAIGDRAFAALAGDSDEALRDAAPVIARMLSDLRSAIRSAPPADHTVYFHTGGETRVDLKSLCGPGDSAEPVLTILLPHED